MEDKNSELLFEYLRSILYDKKIQPLDVEQLDEPFREAWQGTAVFCKDVYRNKTVRSSPFERKSVGAAASAREFFVRKFKKYPCKSKSSDLAGKTGGKG